MSHSIQDRVINATKRAYIRPTILLASLFIVFLNSITLASPFIGIPFSVAVLTLSSAAASALFFPNEKGFLKLMLGLATFIVMMALVGTSLLLVASYTEILSFVGLGAVGLVLCIFSSPKRNLVAPKASNLKEDIKTRKNQSYLLIFPFLLSTGVAFYLLLLARTDEGAVSVWTTIPGLFLPVFFLTSLFLIIALFSAGINTGLKLVLISIYSFLCHSLFFIVWYPGRYGDPWTHLGEERFIDRTGAGYAYAYLVQKLYIVDIVGSKTQYALVTLFRRLFFIDIYWVHVAFVLVLWSIFVPLFSFKIAQMLADGRATMFPLMAAACSILFPELVYWGAFSAPNSLAFLFLFFLVVTLLYWNDTGNRKFWLLSLLASLATFFAHPIPGIFAFIFLFGATIIQSKIPKILKLCFYVILFLSYISALIFRGAVISPEKLLNIESFLTLQSAFFTFPFALSFVGLLLSARSKSFKRRGIAILFLFYATVVTAYYITAFGMQNPPAGTDITRFLPMASLMLIPFVALGLLSIIRVLKAGYSRIQARVSNNNKGHMNLRLTGIILVSLVFASQAIVALYRAYPQSEIMTVQPAAYEIEAVRYIDSKPGKYVVLCDTNLASIAIAFLGTEYGYGGGSRGMFGIPEWEWWTIQLYLQMASSPSVSIMNRAMLGAKAERSYFVISIRNPDFDEIVNRTSEILPADEVFGNGKLYVFSYPSPLIVGVGPSVNVFFDNGTSRACATKQAYISLSEVHYTLTLSGSSSYNISDYPLHWTFENLTINNSSKAPSEPSDINTFILETGLKPNDALSVSWQADEIYPAVGWKEDSFKQGWQTHPIYVGTISPQITTDGNILTISWDFALGSYQYYYYTKSVAISTNSYSYILIKWKSTGPVAVVAVAYKGSEETQEAVVPFNSQSNDWVTTVMTLHPGRETAYVMVGITNVGHQNIAGTQSALVDSILMCAK